MENEQRKKLPAIIIPITVVLLVVIAFLAGMKLRGCEPAPAPTADAAAQDPSALNEWDPQVTDPDTSASRTRSIRIPGYPELQLPAETVTVPVRFVNPEGNPCTFRFELVLDENNETLYTSGLVPPGKAIQEITLSRPLPPGEYAATLRISTASLDTHEAMNGAHHATKLIVT